MLPRTKRITSSIRKKKKNKVWIGTHQMDTMFNYVRLMNRMLNKPHYNEYTILKIECKTGPLGLAELWLRVDII